MLGGGDVRGIAFEGERFEEVLLCVVNNDGL